MPIGTLHRWIDERGFGFIRPDDATRGNDMFVHASAFRAAGIEPELEMSLAYEIESRPDGRVSACNLELIETAEPVD